MRTIELFAKDDGKVDIKTNIRVYATDAVSGPGLIVQDGDSSADMMLVKVIHTDGPVVVTAKPTKPMHAKPFEKGDKIATLIVF